LDLIDHHETQLSHHLDLFFHRAFSGDTFEKTSIINQEIKRWKDQEREMVGTCPIFLEGIVEKSVRRLLMRHQPKKEREREMNRTRGGHDDLGGQERRR